MIAKKLAAALAVTAAVAVAAPRPATARPVVWFDEGGGTRRDGLPQALEAPFDDAYEARSRKTKETRKAASCRQLLELPKGFEPVGPEVDFQAFVAEHVRCQVLSAVQQATPAQVEHLGPFAINDALLDELPAVFVPTPSDDEAKELAAATAKGLSWKQRDRALRVGSARSGEVTVESRKTWNRLRVVARGDLDGDGIEDVIVLRTGGGQRGSWATTDAYLLTRRAPRARLELLRTFSYPAK